MGREAGHPSVSRWGDGGEDLREWRWRSYLDHLEDLGYDLANGERLDEMAAIPVDPTVGADRSTSSTRP